MTTDTRRGAAEVVSVDFEAGTIDINFYAWCKSGDPPFRIPIPLAMPAGLLRAGCEFTCRIPRFRGADRREAPGLARQALLDPTVLTEFEEVPYGDLSIEELEELIGFHKGGDTP